MLEYLKIVGTCVGILSIVFALPVRLILRSYTSIIEEHKDHTEKLNELFLEAKGMQGEIKALEAVKISRPELDARFEKFEKNILDQMKDSEDRQVKSLDGLGRELSKIMDHLLK